MNKSSLFLLIVFGMLNGALNTLGTIIGIIAGNYGYSTGNSSLFGAMFITGGFIGSGIFGGIVQVKKNYKAMTVFIAFISMVLEVILLFLFAYRTPVWVVATGAAFCGFSIVPIVAVAIDFAAEITHPIEP